MKKNAHTVIYSLLLIFLIVVTIPMVSVGHAQTQYSTLADALNATINNVNWSSADSWTSMWGAILAGLNPSAFDNAMNQDIANGNWNDALFVARLADISGYSSSIISSGLLTALQNMPMEGSLPNNYNAHSYGDPNSGCYLVYDRYIIWAYQYAQQYGLTSKWNANQAFADFSKMYNKPPIGSHSGEMLFCDPPGNWAYSYSSRYYDEHAETMSVFLKFGQIGVPGALAYADSAWAGLQTHWNGKYYIYSDSWSIVECEMGNFAQVIAEYMQLKGGNIQYLDRVMQDLNYKLLVNGWNSPGWSTTGVIVHGAGGANPEQRLWETMGVITALQDLYPYFNSTMKTSFDNMMLGANKPWQGLLSSQLNVGGYFKGASGDVSASNDATVCAAATMFLEGIVPVTGNLAIPIHNEQYQDQRTSFPVTEFQFSYANHQITIPVKAGQLTFVYGSTPVSYNFPVDGNYTIKFSNDWNTITNINGQPLVSTPSAPQNLKATAGDSQVSLSWSLPSSNGNFPITNYNIYRSNTPTTETFLASSGNVLSYLDSAVTNGLTYYYTVTAMNVIGESSSTNEVAATPSLPTAFALGVSGFPTSTIAGSSGTLTVTALDTNGNVVSSYNSTVHFSSTDNSANLPTDYTFTAADSGSHIFSAIQLKTAGTQSITAKDIVHSSVTGTQSGIAVTPTSASALIVSGFPNPDTSGTSQSFKITAKDAYGNIATGYVGTVHFTSSDSQAILPANYAFVSTDAGVHVFRATLKTVGTQLITATDTATSSINGAQNGITVNAAVKSLSVSVTTSKLSYSRGSSVPITVTVKDVSTGALLSGASVTVKVINPSGSTLATYTGKTGITGQIQFNYRLNSGALRGTWTVSSIESIAGYPNAAAQTKFKVT